jgi:hypothetical protein
MSRCPDGHENPDGRETCAACGVPLEVRTPALAGAPGVAGVAPTPAPAPAAAPAPASSPASSLESALPGDVELVSTDSNAAVSPEAQSTPAVPVSPDPPEKTHRSWKYRVLVGGLIAGIVAALALGVFGFTRPPSSDAKQQGDRLAAQVKSTEHQTTTIEAASAKVRDTVDQLDALDSSEAVAGNAFIAAFNAAVDRWNAGDKTAFTDPALAAATTTLERVLAQEKALLTQLTADIRAAQGV